VVVQADENRYIAHNPLLPDETLVNKIWAIVTATDFIFIPIFTTPLVRPRRKMAEPAALH
jgi:hypothetical protein